jgi:hypothetical protein
MTNNYETYKQVLRNRCASLRRKLRTATGYARLQLLDQLQETQRLLKEREQERSEVSQ